MNEPYPLERHFKPPPKMKAGPSRDALIRAVAIVGGPVALCRYLGILRSSYYQWCRVPDKRVEAISECSGVPTWELRPDIYPRPE
jgi:DNA-binding transcriptional regulator YdaS (Cro superfamily)